MREAIDIKELHASKDEMNCVEEVPPWLTVMYNTIFFGTCISHPLDKKNDKDYFCIDCLCSLCSNCLPAHTRHKYVKIRRYVYSDVINRQDLHKLFNCSGIQELAQIFVDKSVETYHTNKTKVLFLKRRSPRQQQQQQQNNSRDHSCIICHRSLQDPSLYCCIACKVLSIYGDEHNTDDHNYQNNEKDEEPESSWQDGDEEHLTLASPKRRNQKRKGVPLRAPMF